ncbi:hypothetical protein TKK_0007947 [Trichogramma kaykai]
MVLSSCYRGIHLIEVRTNEILLYIGHIDEYKDKNIEDFYGKTNLMYNHKRLEKLFKTLQLNETCDQRVLHLLKKIQDTFHLKEEELTTMPNVEHAIYTKDDMLVNAKPYRFPQALKDELEKQLVDMLKSLIIEPLGSGYRSNIFLVPKASDNYGVDKLALKYVPFGATRLELLVYIGKDGRVSTTLTIINDNFTLTLITFILF